MGVAYRWGAMAQSNSSSDSSLGEESLRRTSALLTGVGKMRRLSRRPVAPASFSYTGTRRIITHTYSDVYILITINSY